MSSPDPMLFLSLTATVAVPASPRCSNFHPSLDEMVYDGLEMPQQDFGMAEPAYGYWAGRQRIHLMVSITFS